MQDFWIKKDDTLPIIRVQLTNEDTTPVDLTTVSGVLFNYKIRASGSSVVNRTCSIESAESGIVQYQWVSGDSINAGMYKSEFVTVFNGGRMQTFPQGSYFIFEVVEDIS